jgi:hypothetical protein
MKKITFTVLAVILSIALSCSKDNSSKKVAVYYVIEGFYNVNNPYGNTGNEINVLTEMTMPGGSTQSGSVRTPYTAVSRDYEPGETLTLRGESVPAFTTITIKLIKDGVEWKKFTTTANDYGQYAVATVTGTI